MQLVVADSLIVTSSECIKDASEKGIKRSNSAIRPFYDQTLHHRPPPTRREIAVANVIIFEIKRYLRGILLFLCLRK